MTAGILRSSIAADLRQGLQWMILPWVASYFCFPYNICDESQKVSGLKISLIILVKGGNIVSEELVT
jgi:hypothetical protein